MGELLNERRAKFNIIILKNEIIKRDNIYEKNWIYNWKICSIA